MAEYRFFRDVAHESVVVCFVFFRICCSARFLPIFKSQLKHLSFESGISSTGVQCLAGKCTEINLSFLHVAVAISVLFHALLYLSLFQYVPSFPTL